MRGEGGVEVGVGVGLKRVVMDVETGGVDGAVYDC